MTSSLRSRTEQAFARLLIAGITAAVFAPVLGYPFLQVAFDDPAFVQDNPAVGPFTLQRLGLCFTHFTLYDYLPLPLLSYLLDFQVWGLWPGGYHLTNVVLHIFTAWAVHSWVVRATGNATAGLFAGLLFAVHPVQVEAVAIVAQRKTILATLFVVLSLLAYHVWLERPDHRRAYAASLLAYLAACLSKSSVTPFPLLLLWYDRWFAQRPVGWRSKLPFFGLAAATALVSLIPKWGEVVKPAHGGVGTTVLLMARVWWEYLGSFFLPVNLSPAYYYRATEVHSWTSTAAVVALIGLVWFLVRHGRRFPALTFWLGWTAISLLPVSNLVPLAVVRADRYLYLPMVGFSYWSGLTLARARSGERWPRRLVAPRLAGLVLAGLAAVCSARYVSAFRSDVVARQVAVDRHPWAAPAHYLLALAYLEEGNPEAAQAAALAAIRNDATFFRAHELLARVYEWLGDAERAALHAEAARAGRSGGR